MTNSNSAMGLRDSAKAGLTAKRPGLTRRAGTTLVEILVVIVIFLIGILAVVQVFPRGFKLLITTRNNSVATALGRDAMERLKSSPEQIPDEIVPVRYSGGQAVVDTTINPLDLGPLGDSLSATAVLTGGGANGRNWQLASGPNVARRIIGEGQRLPAPRYIGDLGASAANKAENYGSLMVLGHGPIDPNIRTLSNGAQSQPYIVAYANDLTRTLGAPRETRAALVPGEVADASVGLATTDADGNVTAFTVPDGRVVTPVSVAPFEFFVVNSGGSDASILVPANHQVPRTYRVRMSAYVGNSGTYKRYDYLSLSVTVPIIPETGVSLVRVPLAPLIASTNEVKSGGILASIEAETVQVAPQYVNVDARSGSLKGVWTSNARINGGSDYTPIDPFEFKVRDANLGVLLFSPAGRDGAVTRPGGVSEPLLARVDYDVRDWHVIGEDFRVVDDNGAFSLSIQSLKVGGNTGPDGLPNGGMFLASNSWDPSPSPRDNVVVMDLTTGYEVQRALDSANPYDAGGRANADATGAGAAANNVYVSVDKSKGTVVLLDADPRTPALDVRLIPPSGAPITVPAANRTFRVLYRAREEWAVQILKGASHYSVVSALQLAPDQAFVGDTTGGTLRTRLYFPVSEAGHKITVDRIAYVAPDGSTGLLEGQDFILQAPRTNEPSYAYADIARVVNTAAFSYDYGTPVRGIKGGSVTVRVLWNPEAFNLGADGGTNLRRLDQWGRGWRKSLTETYLRAEEAR